MTFVQNITNGMENINQAEEFFDRTTKKSVIEHNACDLEALFHHCFFIDYATVLRGGFDEPIYQPKANKHNPQSGEVNTICYRDDYFSSALHEVSHWCIAGKARRTKVDYGYWYSPDGRTPQQQAKFENVEVKPQAIEWAFSAAANLDFRVSIDNLNAPQQEDASKKEQEFTQQVKRQLMHYIKNGFPLRAELFIQALHHFYQSPCLRSQFL